MIIGFQNDVRSGKLTANELDPSTSPPATTARAWYRRKQLLLLQAEFSRVISRSKIGNVVISGSPGMPLASGVMKNTQTTVANLVEKTDA